MEYEENDKISQLLGDINLYHTEPYQSSPPQASPSQTSSSQNEKSDKESKTKKNKDVVDEKYFHFKLKHLLNMSDDLSFSNVEIEIASFLKDIESYIDDETKKNKLDVKKALEIKDEIKNSMIGEKKVELDSCFINVPGKEVNQFFKSLEKYSFPSQTEKLLENESYVILVESTHSLTSQIPKKTEELRKYYLFFSLLDKWLNDYKQYLGTFYDYFIGRYFLRLNSSNTKFSPKTYKANFSLSRKFVILIINDHTLKVFQETITRIEKSQFPQTLKSEVKKCFPNLYEKEKKNYKNELSSNEIKEIKDKKEIKGKGKKNEKSFKESVMENLPYLNYLINQINKEINWTVKIIYLDLYFDLIVPNCVVADSLNSINNGIQILQDNVNTLKEQNVELERKNETLERKNETLEKKINEMMEFIRKYFNVKDLSDFLKNSEKQDECQKKP